MAPRMTFMQLYTDLMNAFAHITLNMARIEWPHGTHGGCREKSTRMLALNPDFEAQDGRERNRGKANGLEIHLVKRRKLSDCRKLRVMW